MHLMTLKTPLVLQNDTLAAGDYLLEDRNAWEFGYSAEPGSVEMRAYEAAGCSLTNTQSNPSGDWNGKKILLIRPGGRGALMFLGCVIRQIKHRWPDCTVEIACRPPFREVFAGLPYPDGFSDYPVPWAETWGEHNAVVSLEGCTEWGEDARNLHIVDAFAKRCGIEVPEFPTARYPSFAVSVAERLAVGLKYPYGDKPRLALQPFGSVGTRCYPFEQMITVVGELQKRGWEIMLVGSPQDGPPGRTLGNVQSQPRDGVFNAATEFPGFRQQCSVVACSDAFLGPDSVFLHVAGALGIPAVGLFGSTSWRLRTSGAGTQALTSPECEMAPCHYFPRGWFDFPQNEKAPCSNLRRCSALAGIKPERIVAKVDALRPTKEKG